MDTKNRTSLLRKIAVRHWSFRTLACALLALSTFPVIGEEVDTEDVATLFGELGADEFAVRERAATRLNQMGVGVVPELIALSQASDDPEIKMRAGEIVRRLSDDDMAGRIEDFLSGQEIEFQGWQVVRVLLGDSRPIRELFVDLTKQHPDVVKSLEETTRDRVMALDRTLSTIEHKMFKQMEMPSQTDTFAIFLPVVDLNLPLDKRFEPLALSVLRVESATKIKNDAQLSVPFKNILSRWIRRSTKENRANVLELTLLWDLEIGVELAERTLQETHSAETLAYAMQVVSRFGGREQIEAVFPFLKDRGVVIEQGFVRGKEIQTLVCDVAAVTIARLYNIELSTLGYPDSVNHRTLSFIPEEIGFGKNETELRTQMLEKVLSIHNKQPPIPRPRLPALR